MMRAMLNSELEKSSAVPSWLKWYSHHCGSCAVAMLARVADDMNTMSSIANFGVEMAETDR